MNDANREPREVESFYRSDSPREYWRARCQACTWTSRDLPFESPDAALHALKLHGVLCIGAKP